MMNKIPTKSNQLCIHQSVYKYVCLKQDCTLPRGICPQCINELHNNHHKEVISVKELQEKSIQYKKKFQDLLKLIEQSQNSIHEITQLLENFSNDKILYPNFEQHTNQLIDLDLFCKNIENLSLNLNKMIQQGRKCCEINEISMNQNRQISQQQRDWQSIQFQSINIDFKNIIQNIDNGMEINEQDRTLSCSEYHGLFILGDSLISDIGMQEITIQLLKVGSIKFGLGYKKFVEDKKWPDLQGNVNHGCYLIDEYGFVYEHGRENQIYNIKENNHKWNFQMCVNDKITLKINFKNQTITWKNYQRGDYIELSKFDQTLTLCPLILLSGSSIRII